MPYFIKVADRPFGPFDESQLAEMKARGRINPSTDVSSDRVHWQPASELDFLFPSRQQQAQGGAAEPGSPLPPVGPPVDQAIWFYSFDGNSGFGPVSRSAIVQMLQSGQLNERSYVWKEGHTALFLKSVPEFSRYFGGVGTTDASRPAVQDHATRDYPRSGGDTWRPLERSIGWLMFLKVLCLTSWIIFGLFFIFGVIFMMSRAVAGDSATVLLGTIVVVLLESGYYYLMFRPFWALWQYHTFLQRAVVSRQDAELEEANRHLFQLWKDSGIIMIVNLAIIVLILVAAAISAGSGVGLLERFQRL